VSEVEQGSVSRVHLAFQAPDRNTVQRFHMAALGAEAGSKEQQEKIKKKIDIEGDLESSLRRLNQRGIQTGVSWIIGYPGEGFESMRATLEAEVKALDPAAPSEEAARRLREAMFQRAGVAPPPSTSPLVPSQKVLSSCALTRVMRDTTKTTRKAESGSRTHDAPQQDTNGEPSTKAP
jgi:hypothetical protein